MEFKVNTATKTITLITGANINTVINSLQVLRELYGKDWTIEISKVNEIQYIPYEIKKTDLWTLPGIIGDPLVPYVGDILPQRDNGWKDQFWYTFNGNINYCDFNNQQVMFSSCGNTINGESIISMNFIDTPAKGSIEK